MDRLTTMEAFVRVVDAGSFSAAARRWGRSKAVVSKYVSALEAQLGVTLLRRTTRTSSLTDAGRLCYARCVDVLGEVDALESAVRDDRLSPRGVLRLTLPPGLASRHLQIITSDFVARYPDVKLDVHLTHRMTNLVDEGYDVAIRVTEPRDSTLVARHLTPAPIIAVAAPAYLDRRGKPREPRDLDAHDCLVDTNFRDQGGWPFEHDGKRIVVQVDGPFRVNSPLAVRDLACAGHGIALVPAFLVQSHLADGRLVELLPGSVALRWSIYAVYPRRTYIPARLRAFIDHLVDRFGDDTASDRTRTQQR